MKVSSPLQSKTYFEIIKQINKGNNYNALIYKELNLTQQATNQALQNLVKHKLIPKPEKEKLLNKNIYSIDINLFLDFFNKSIGYKPKQDITYKSIQSNFEALFMIEDLLNTIETIEELCLFVLIVTFSQIDQHQNKNSDIINIINKIPDSFSIKFNLVLGLVTHLTINN
jgi:hypothetical protein